MLVALKGSNRIHASVAEKGHTFHCPGCHTEVTLKKGAKVIHHFAHKPPVTCSWAVGETKAHLSAKNLFLEHLTNAGYKADVEYPIGTQRADVHFQDTNGISYVIEIQHQPITPSEISRRTEGYFRAGAVVTWLPLIDIAKLAPKAEQTATGYVIKRYTPKPFERWLHGFHFKEMWFVDPSTGMLWKGTFSDEIISVPYSEWYVSGGDTESAGGYDRTSKRCKKLTITGPIPLGAIQLGSQIRKQSTIGGHVYPQGRRLIMTTIPS